MFSELSQPEKDVSDLVFEEGSDESEVLFRNRLFQLRRYDLVSFISDTKISTNVINAWANLLNKREELKAASSPLRLYAFVTHNGIKCEDITEYDNVKLVSTKVNICVSKPMMFPLHSVSRISVRVNMVSRKIEVIHPMHPKSVDFSDSVRMVRDFVRCDMVSKSFRFKTVQFFSCEEFVPKTHAIDVVDDGIYLMCYMETYTGSRQLLKSQFINSRSGAAIGKTLLKQKMKYCFAVLSCPQNELSKQVLMAAKRLNVKSGKQAAVKEVEYTDTHLLDYVFLIRAGESAKDDVVVKTSFGQVTKEGMCSLKPRKWVADMVW
ncbi:uncharacterized protein LOC141627622 [Silene latifolia]|uniref:uncharacterized protein LOC141627622 n=1 Tax=Silene latifolia TaxID=37657 RepID=UPI003D76B46F